MGRNTRRMRRAGARRRRAWPDGGPVPSPVVTPGRIPGTIDVAIPIPPGMTPDEARAFAEDFAAHAGLTVAGLHFCTPDTCPHLHTSTPTHEQE